MEQRRWRNLDPWLLLLPVGLSSLGVMMILSATSVPGAELAPEVGAHAIASLIGVALLVVVTLIDYRWWRSLWWLAYLAAIAFLVFVIVSGETRYGAQRWVGIAGIPFQPSEFVKLACIIALARILADHARDGRHFRGFALSLILLLPLLLLIYQQPDLATALVLVAIWLGMTLVAGVPLWMLIASLFAPVVAWPLIWRFLKDYMRQRIMIFLSPDSDPLGAGYNMIQARISIGSGGWWGRGLGEGTQTQLNFLRVRHTDFIFAVVGEELGFFGAVGVLVAYAWLIIRCLAAITSTTDVFGRLLATGVATMLLFEIFVNVGVNLGLVPVAGIPLPFLSYGRSALLANFLALGLVQSVRLYGHRRRYDSSPAAQLPLAARLRRAALPASRTTGAPPR